MWADGARQPQTAQDPLRAAFLTGGAVCVQLRLLCNMLDGLIAVENNLKSPTGDLFNEVPDRIEDVVLLVGAGVAAAAPGGVTLGWAAAVLAVSTAYVRLLGGSLGFKQDFCGPFAKQHRMFFLTVACLLAAAEAAGCETRRVLVWSLVLIVAGTGATAIRRLARMARQLQNRTP